MSRRRRWVLAACGALLAPGVVVLLASGSGAATSAAGPAAITDGRATGALTLLNTAGIPVTAGADLTHLADFALAASESSTVEGEAQLSVVRPVATQADSAAWPVLMTSPATPYPVTGLGVSLDQPKRPAIALGVDLAAVLHEQRADDAHPIVQLRLRTLSPESKSPERYWSAEIEVDATAGTWQLLAPIPLIGSAPATVALGPVSVEARAPKAPVVIRSTLSTAGGRRPIGAARLVDSGRDVGPASYDRATGIVRVAVSTISGRHSYRLRFVPVDSVGVGSPALALTFTQGEPAAIAVSLVVTATPARGDLAFGTTSLSATAAPAGATGTVTFSDSRQGVLGRVRVVAGHAVLLTNALGAGRHVITASFAPTACTPYRPVTASAPAIVLTAAQPAAAGVPVQVRVDAGQLTITTPYTAEHPLSLGSLVLAADGSKLMATAHFGSVSDAATKGVTITDTRAGERPWSASLAATDFVSGQNSISAQNLGFVGIRPLAVPGGVLGTTSRPVVPRDLPGATVVQAAGSAGKQGLGGTPKTFATAVHGTGSVYLYGDLMLDAPTATPSGLYAATLTFTVG